MKQFIYCESTEGGMDSFIFSNPNQLSHLFAWMNPDCATNDEKLVAWLESSDIGDYYFHRLGIVIRLKNLERENIVPFASELRKIVDLLELDTVNISGSISIQHLENGDISVKSDLLATSI